jgi:tryptophan-rich sensory protein
MGKLLSYIVHVLIFAGALGIGGLFTSRGLATGWYGNLNLPPWQPPSWTFGAAWTTIMLTFPVAMAYLLPLDKLTSSAPILALFVAQWILNVLWNYLFFTLHQTGISLVEITLLAVVVGALTYFSFRAHWVAGFACLPYLIWLCIATSLNAYIWKMN